MGALKTIPDNSGARELHCPQCGQALPGEARECPACGVDLALVSLLVEKAFLDGFPDTAPIQTTPQAIVPRIGEYLREQNLIDKAQLQQALEYQADAAARGQAILLGQTLVELGMIDRESLDRALTKQIITLHAAVQSANRNLEQRVKQRTAELRHVLARVSEINQLKANIISNTSHELRTPLAHIIGYVELISDGQLGELNQEQQHAIEVIERASARLNTLIDNLIAFSTASREGIQLKQQAVSPEALLQETINRSVKKAQKARVEIVYEITSVLPKVSVDKERLLWVLVQLVDNGIKFTPAGGKVVLSALRRDGAIIMSVADTGIGIPEDRRDELFEPFHQLDGSSTRRYGGAGLGLALVKLILEAHGTALGIESEEGKGSTFSFPLPLAGGP
jgi:signal transduction histidine kinase